MSEAPVAVVLGGTGGIGSQLTRRLTGAGTNVLAVARTESGLVRTPLTERITSNERASEASRVLHVLGRLGEPEDVASAIAWLVLGAITSAIPCPHSVLSRASLPSSIPKVSPRFSAWSATTRKSRGRCSLALMPFEDVTVSPLAKR